MKNLKEFEKFLENIAIFLEIGIIDIHKNI